MAGKRRIVRVPDMAPGRAQDTGPAPIPDGARIGNVVCSSLLSGRDAQTGGEHPADPNEQAAALFRNVRAFMEQAGGTPDDIVQLTVYLRDEQYRSAINSEWLKMFPDAQDRPGRIVVYREFRLESSLIAEVSLIAVL